MQFVRRANSIVEGCGWLVAITAMLRIGYRAAVRLDTPWDTLWYHLPFAARRAGIAITYSSPPRIQDAYEGFPPLADFLQGVLWLFTRSVNAISVVNYLGLSLFAYFCWRHLNARLWVVLLLSLTAPLVLIHASSNYIDLFTNALLAIGVSMLLAMILFDRWREPRLLLWGLAGLSAAAWSKFQAVPTATVVFFVLLGVYWRRAGDPQFRKMATWVAAAALFASLPYVKNEILYRNPFWPVEIPGFSSDIFPYTQSLKANSDQQTPPQLRGRSKSELFFRSLFEIGHPTSYGSNERWTLDAGGTGVAFRSGGLWSVAVITAALAACLLGFLAGQPRGWMAMASIGAMWCLLSVLPQSAELRYYLFLPLSVAALIAMLIPHTRTTHPAVTLMVLLVFLAEFAYVTKFNRTYYRINRAGYMDEAQRTHVTALWELMEEGKTYCVVGFEPIGVLFTGPSMHEYNILDRPHRGLCPPGVKVFERHAKRF